MDSRVKTSGHFASRPLAGKVLVVGLGKTGLSCARFLLKQGFEVAVIDSRERPPGLEAVREELPGLPLFLGHFNHPAVHSADSLVVSPGVPLTEPVVAEAIRQGKPVMGDIELFARYADAPVAAITGSNGKSTVTTLLGEILREEGIKAGIGGNLGEPALELLGKGAELYVLELSSFQLDTTASLMPCVATVLNISPDHMDRYADLDAYIASKARIYRGAENRVFNGDDAAVMAMAELREEDRAFTLGEPSGNQYGLKKQDGRLWLCRGEEPFLAASELLIPGRHNMANALAAIAMADLMGVSDPSKLSVLRQFRGLPHRTQLVAEHQGVRWYNDSKGTNVGATAAALDGLGNGEGGGKVVLIAGGDCKGAEFRDLAPVAQRTVRTLVLIGRDAPMIEAALRHRVPMVKAKDMTEAVALSASHARPGDSVLLSPACASFDMFNNYMHRGDVFAKAVRDYCQ
ncbi:MAG: UDP-N-acetylmuramoyl-L-alanine--D-glutamate ligase [Gammaproteobacteria bacterium]|nr:UDP-N-acetylmuramoyl-L-alanine--D-glutamate ligase [Gammaproteobacteria bacterium]MBU1654207.1 UDP-N-acetylmuramoyl-L-alanine--D-glutamate ligase [Gammaproteobacteria bacterium]MBU1960867.1 UDP-N-acetylmuramoyl-L-alanine--D-glutamate ligase [Gammaproteobacteria bacterium]